MDVLGQRPEILRPHAETRHLLHAQPERAGRGKPLFVRRRLVVADDVVLLEPAGRLHRLGIFHLHDHLMGLRKGDRRIAGHLQARIPERPRQRPSRFG